MYVQLNTEEKPVYVCSVKNWGKVQDSSPLLFLCVQLKNWGKVQDNSPLPFLCAQLKTGEKSGILRLCHLCMFNSKLGKHSSVYLAFAVDVWLAQNCGNVRYTSALPTQLTFMYVLLKIEEKFAIPRLCRIVSNSHHYIYFAYA